MIGFWLINISSALVVSAVITALILNLVGARTIGKKPHNQKGRGGIENPVTIPLAGILLAPVVLASTLLVLGIRSFWNAPAIKTSLLELGTDPFFLICAFLIIYLLGLCKDLSRVRESVKFIVEGVCAILIALSGIEITSLQGLLSVWEIPRVVALVLTMGVLIGGINSIAIINESLSVGKAVCYIALLFYTVVLWEVGDNLFATIGAAFFGSIIVGDNPRKTTRQSTLGSTGAFTTGLILALLAIRLGQTQTVEFFGKAPVILGFTPLIVIIALGVYAYLRQYRAKK